MIKYLYKESYIVDTVNCCTVVSRGETPCSLTHHPIAISMPTKQACLNRRFVIDATNVNIIGNVDGAYKVVFTNIKANKKLSGTAENAKKQVTYLQNGLESEFLHLIKGFPITA